MYKRFLISLSTSAFAMMAVLPLSAQDKMLSTVPTVIAAAHSASLVSASQTSSPQRQFTTILAKQSPSSENSAELMDLSSKKITLTELFAKYEGKIIYLDFWASWCGPCLAEMPYSRRLKEKIKDSNVVMLYISLDENFSKWTNASKRIGLDPDKSLVLINVSGDPFFKRVDIAYIPRYVIIDKQGKISDANAARPSSKGIASQLEKLSKRK